MSNDTATALWATAFVAVVFLAVAVSDVGTSEPAITTKPAERVLAAAETPFYVAYVDPAYEAYAPPPPPPPPPPEPEPEPEPVVVPAPAPRYAATDPGDHLARIRACESGGNYAATSPDGTYRGAYQFDQRTWEGVGGTGDPADASPEEQDARAAELYAQRGGQPWPTCRYR